MAAFDGRQLVVTWAKSNRVKMFADMMGLFYTTKYDSSPSTSILCP
jgi:hypothetical protein